MKLLDLFCGAGGASTGYRNAGFDIVGVDHNYQPRYPFKLIRTDALEYLRTRGEWAGLAFDVIHASPPCQEYSRAMSHLAYRQEELIDDVKLLLERTGLPWVIENVPGAPIPSQPTLDGRHGLELCGTQFGLRISRHRLFESSVPLTPPERSCHCGTTKVLNPHYSGSREEFYAEHGRQDMELAWVKEMGVEWMERYEGREAIPPAYTEFIGNQLRERTN